jgi:hypothetical protein
LRYAVIFERRLKMSSGTTSTEEAQDRGVVWMKCLILLWAVLVTTVPHGTAKADLYKLLYSHDFEDQDPYGGYFASGISGGFSGGVDETVIYPGQDPSERFTGPIVDTSTVFENDPDGATFMQNYFYLGGGTKDNVQPASAGGGPRDPVVLSLSGISDHFALILDFDMEAIGSWDDSGEGYDEFQIQVTSTGEVLMDSLTRDFAQTLSYEFDHSLGTLEVRWINDNTGRDEFFGLDNVQVTAVVPAPGAALLGTLGLSFSGWILRRHRVL